MENSIERPWCIAPFISTFKTPNKTGPCCETSYLLSPGESHADFWNRDDTKKLRKAMLEFDKDSLPDDCKRCLSSATSHSQFFYLECRPQFYETFLDVLPTVEPDGYMPEVKLAHLAIGPSNVCNYSCRMCITAVSSTKYRMQDRAGMISPDNEFITMHELLPQVDSKYRTTDPTEECVRLVRENKDTLAEIVLHGGDPIQNPDFPEVMDALDELDMNCKITFLSNGSVEKMSNGDIIWDRLQNFKDLHVVFSMDGIPEVNEYIRHNCKHDRLMKLIKTARERLPHAYIGVHSTFSTYSALRYGEFLQYFYENLEPLDVWLSMNVVNAPFEYAPCHLPDDLKRVAMQNLLDFTPQRDYHEEIKREALQALFTKPADPKVWDSFLKEEITFNHGNGLKLTEALPMLKPYFPEVIAIG